MTISDPWGIEKTAAAIAAEKRSRGRNGRERVIEVERDWEVEKEEVLCPLCGSRMRMQRPRGDSVVTQWHPFWECTRSPECRGMRDLELQPIGDDL